MNEITDLIGTGHIVPGEIETEIHAETEGQEVLATMRLLRDAIVFLSQTVTGLEAAIFKVAAPEGSALKCIKCFEFAFNARRDLDNGVLWDGQEPVVPEVKDAITMAPSWQSQSIMNQMLFACVPLPCCEEHLEERKETPIERATKSGLALPGTN
jgi:hypothetical protein